MHSFLVPQLRNVFRLNLEIETVSKRNCSHKKLGDISQRFRLSFLFFLRLTLIKNEITVPLTKRASCESSLLTAYSDMNRTYYSFTAA